MRKKLAFLLSALMILSLCGCGKEKTFSPMVGTDGTNLYISNYTTDVRFFGYLDISGTLAYEMDSFPILYSVEDGMTFYTYMDGGIKEAEIIEDPDGVASIQEYMLTKPIDAEQDVKCIPIKIQKYLPGKSTFRCRFTDYKGNTCEVPISILSMETCLYYCEDGVFTKEMNFPKEGKYRLKLYTVEGDKSSYLTNATEENGEWTSSFLGMDVKWHNGSHTLTVTIDDLDKAILDHYYISYTSNDGIQYMSYFTIG